MKKESLTKKIARLAIFLALGIVLNIIESMIPSGFISWDAVDPGRISVIPIEMAKGLEFESIIVVSNFMSNNEKYIAFTRALENLYVAESIQAKLVESMAR